LKCDCLGDVFSGTPCRHSIVIFIKSTVDFILLPFNQRWCKDFYVEQPTILDPDDLYSTAICDNSNETQELV